jgi:hypothetical protein
MENSFIIYTIFSCLNMFFSLIFLIDILLTKGFPEYVDKFIA